MSGFHRYVMGDKIIAAFIATLLRGRKFGNLSLNQRVVGSSPTSPTNLFDGLAGNGWPIFL